MPVISLINAKGGSGKTTTAMILADRISAAGNSVFLLDTDPNGACQTWFASRDDSLGRAPFDVKHVIQDNEIVREIENAQQKYDVVVVDTEGRPNLAITRVLSRTHLAILPMNGSFLDAQQAERIVALVENEAEMMRSHIEYRLMFSRMPAAVVTTSTKDLVKMMKDGQFPMIGNALNDRRAFRDIFQYCRTLSELVQGVEDDLKRARQLEKKDLVRKLSGQKEGYEKAVRNADEVVGEIMEVLAQMADN